MDGKPEHWQGVRAGRLGIVFENRRISRVIALKTAQNWPNLPVFAPV
jgi:hypothetical protein